jgi:hypothetical protein
LNNGFNLGSILWFKPESGRGVVKLDDGRQFFFDENSGISDPVKGLRVLARSQKQESGPAKVDLALPAGGRQFAEVDPAPAAKRRPAAKKTRKRAAATPKIKTGPKRGVVKRVVRRGESLERGISVAHPLHGHGFVVLSTSSMARIRFMPSQEERSVRITDLEILEGN